MFGWLTSLFKTPDYKGQRKVVRDQVHDIRNVTTGALLAQRRAERTTSTLEETAERAIQKLEGSRGPSNDSTTSS